MSAFIISTLLILCFSVGKVAGFVTFTWLEVLLAAAILYGVDIAIWMIREMNK